MITYQLPQADFTDYNLRKDLAYKLARIVDLSSSEITLVEVNEPNNGLTWYIDRYNQWKITFHERDKFTITYCQLDRLIEAETALDLWIRFKFTSLIKISYRLDPNLNEFNNLTWTAK